MLYEVITIIDRGAEMLGIVQDVVALFLDDLVADLPELRLHLEGDGSRRVV